MNFLIQVAVNNDGIMTVIRALSNEIDRVVDWQKYESFSFLILSPTRKVY